MLMAVGARRSVSGPGAPSLCRGPPLFVPGPRAPSECRGPALFVSAPSALCHGPALLLSVGARRSVSGPVAPYLCQGPALFVSGPARSECRGPARLLSVGARRSLCRGPALLVSGPGAPCVGARRSLHGGRRQGTVLLCEDSLWKSRRSACRVPVLSVALCVGGPAVLFQLCLCRGPALFVSGPGALLHFPDTAGLCWVWRFCLPVEALCVGARRFLCRGLAFVCRPALSVGARRSF